MQNYAKDSVLNEPRESAQSNQLWFWKKPRLPFRSDSANQHLWLKFIFVWNPLLLNLGCSFTSDISGYLAPPASQRDERKKLPKSFFWPLIKRFVFLFSSGKQSKAVVSSQTPSAVFLIFPMFSPVRIISADVLSIKRRTDNQSCLYLYETYPVLALPWMVSLNSLEHHTPQHMSNLRCYKLSTNICFVKQETPSVNAVDVYTGIWYSTQRHLSKHNPNFFHQFKTNPWMCLFKLPFPVSIQHRILP